MDHPVQFKRTMTNPCPAVNQSVIVREGFSADSQSVLKPAWAKTLSAMKLKSETWRACDRERISVMWRVRIRLNGILHDSFEIQLFYPVCVCINIASPLPSFSFPHHTQLTPGIPYEHLAPGGFESKPVMCCMFHCWSSFEVGWVEWVSHTVSERLKWVQHDLSSVLCSTLHCSDSLTE